MRLLLSLSALAVAATISIGCGGGTANREQLLADLREAMERNVEADADLERNNDLVVQVVEASALSRMSRLEVEQAIGRGTPCAGGNQACERYELNEDDWIYDVGRISGGLPGGPTLLLGFDTAGRVLHHYYVTRER